MSQRLERVKEAIHRQLAEILLKENDFSPDILVTVIKVDIPSDLQTANVFIGVLPETKSRDILAALTRDVYSLQQKLNQRVKTRPVPKIRFVAAKDAKTEERVEELLEKIKKD